MGHLGPDYQWNISRHNLSLLTPTRARGISISPSVWHRHRVFHIQAREARAWVEVEYKAHRPGLRGPKGVFTPLHLRLSLQISRIYKVCFYSRSYGQEYYLILESC